MTVRRLAAVIALGMVAGACAAAEPATTSAFQSAATTAPDAAGAPATSSTPASSDAEAGPDARPAPAPDRPLAPDFELVLGSGDVFTLSAETRPVFLVFWAEW